MAEYQTRTLNSEQWPQFFKIYMPAHCSTQLRIPPAFLKKFRGSIPLKFNLLTSATNSWEVGMNKIDDDVYFKTGWDKFVQDNLLEFGDFLIFYYHGGLNFFVSIFSTNNCLKKINIPNTNIDNEPIPIQEIQETETEAETEAETEVEKEAETEETGERIEDRNASFNITIQPCYMSGWYMNIPRKVFLDVVKEHRPMMVKLQHLGRTWDVTVAYYKQRIRFTTGWREFATQNCLGVGDVCWFKVTDVKPEFYSLVVSFCREI